MIIKESAGRDGGKKAGAFLALAKYLEKGDSSERVLDSHTTNTVSEDIYGAALEIMATQLKNDRTRKNPNYHLIVSFANGEKVSLEKMKEMEQKIVDALGFKYHQRIMVVHGDTDNLHFHIGINRINPKTLKVHSPWQSKRTLQEVSAKLEEEYGLVKVNHQTTRTLGQSKAHDMEAHRGQESMITYAQSIADQLKRANTWDNLHETLEKYGLQIKEQGQGFVIGDGKTFIKASSVDRYLSKKHLIARLGELNESNKTATAKSYYTAKPIENGYVFVSKERREALKKEWSDLQKSIKDEKAGEIKALSDKYKALSDKAYSSLQSERKQVYENWRPGMNTKDKYTKISDKFNKEKDRLKLKKDKETAAVYEGRLESWKDYCHRKAKAGSLEHLNILRSLERHEKLKKNILTGHNYQELPWQWSRVTKGGVIKFTSKHGTISDEGKSISSEKINMQSVAFLVDIAIYKYALGDDKKIKINQQSDKKFKRMVVSYAKANGIGNKIENFDKLNDLYGRKSVVKVYQEKIINKIRHSIGLCPSQFREVIPKSEFSKAKTMERKKEQFLSL